MREVGIAIAVFRNPRLSIATSSPCKNVISAKTFPKLPTVLGIMLAQEGLRIKCFAVRRASRSATRSPGPGDARGGNDWRARTAGIAVFCIRDAAAPPVRYPPFGAIRTLTKAPILQMQRTEAWSRKAASDAAQGHRREEPIAVTDAST